MQSFVVSARKYRPATWDDVVGQDQVVSTLKNAILNNHLAQSFLFCGPRGVGKTTCARIFAKTINCENIQANGEACNVCESCTTFNGNASFNIFEMDAASNNSVDDIRNLTDQVRYAPQEGKYKIYIIDEVHMLSTAAFNAFLKSLEEPPAYVKFILATTEKQKIIPTILSRCQIFDFSRIKIKDMAIQLQKICTNEGVVCDEQALHLIAQRADGAMRDALSIFDRITSYSGKRITAKDVIDNLNILDSDYYFTIADAFLIEDVSACLLLFDEIIAHGFDGDTFLSGLAEHFRNLLVCKQASTVMLLDTSESILEKYKNQAQLISASFLLSALNITNQAEIHYKASKNKRLHVELVLMKLCFIHNSVSTLQHVEKKTLDLNKKSDENEKTPEQNVPKVIVEKKHIPLPKDIQNSQAHLIDIVAENDTVIIPKKNNLREEIIKTEAIKELPDASVIIAKEKILITPEAFFTAWKNYADLIRKIKLPVAVIMDHARVSIADNKIEIKVSAAMEVSLMRDVSQELNLFLAEALENKSFEISYVVEVQNKEVNQRPYTTMEKYKKMEELNPVLRQLKEKLGLELDY